MDCQLPPRREHGFPKAHPDPGALFLWLGSHWMRPLTRSESWEEAGGPLPQRFSGLVVSDDYPIGAPPSSRPPSAAWLRSLVLPEGAVAAGRGRGRVGVEPSGGGRNGCCLPGPMGRAGLPEPPLPPPPQLKAAPRGASSHPERAAIERAEVLGGGVCCPQGLNEADLGNIPFALLSLLT